MANTPVFTQPSYKNPYPNSLGNQSSSGLAQGAKSYKPNNGFNNSPYQPGFQSHGTAHGTVVSVPADKSDLILRDMLGNSFDFEFDYSGTSPDPGNITVALPALGGTTADVAAALIAAINANSEDISMTAESDGTATGFIITQKIAGPSATNNYSISGVAGTDITFAGGSNFSIGLISQVTPGLFSWLPGPVLA